MAEADGAAGAEAAQTADDKVKIILLGDSAVGKSKLMERFLLDGYKPQQMSTYALTLYHYDGEVDGKQVNVDFWDTAGQERFQTMHPSYYHQAEACVLVFDAQRKVTYKNLDSWYKELRQYRPKIPCIVVANKIDADKSVTQRSFNFPKKYKLPFFFVSAANGTNVVRIFKEAIQAAYAYKANSTDVMDQMLREMEAFAAEGGDFEYDEVE
ncbi:rab-like protein 2A [Sycon ciliatum]|uniref:rab-like protein 2A n=1 Tax=Sycon ciliatum TaxID=27933 RepID=UPI0031F698AC